MPLCFCSCSAREILSASDAESEAKSFRTVAENGGCFAAGTLVHTKDGLVPIEQIKVGDWVLSQPQGQGQREFKRVVNTFQYDNKSVWTVSFIAADDSSQPECLVVTGVHPFWVKGEGWTRVDKLHNECMVELADGRDGLVIGVREVYATYTEGVGWVEDLAGSNNQLSYADGAMVDLRHGAPRVDFFAPTVSLEGPPGDFGRWQGTPLASRVYNIEVEDFHTYYVGTSGVWVRNQDCNGSTIQKRES